MIVHVDNLSVVFRRGFRGAERQALDHVNLHIEERDFLALLGPNGAGKTTTVYCILGLLSA